MQDTYFVQIQARRILKCLHNRDYTNLSVCPSYLLYTDEPNFWEAFGEMHSLFERFYTQAAEAPKELSLPMYAADIVGYGEILKGLHPLLDLPITLFAIGVASVWENNTLTVNVAEFKQVCKDLRCKNYTNPINWLAENGFTFTVWNGKTFGTKNKTFTLDYPDNPDLLIVLSVICNKLEKYMQSKAFVKGTRRAHNAWGLGQFVFLDPHIYADDIGELPPVKLNHLLGIANERYRNLICEIVDRFTQRGFGIHYSINPHGNSSCEVFDKKGKDTLNCIRLIDTIDGEGEEAIHFRLKLNHPDKYINKVEALPPHLKERFEKVWCQNCAEKCNRKIKYTLDGTAKVACGCDVFIFINPQITDLDILLNLFDAEQVARAQK